MMAFKMELKQIALYSVAASLWDHPRITQKRKLFWFDKFPTVTEWQKGETEWNNVIKEALIQIKRLELPHELQIDLIHVVKSMGIKIYSWSIRIFTLTDYNCQMLWNLTKHVHWTQNGAIDEVKILNLHWMKSRNQNTGCSTTMLRWLNDMCCYFATEECLHILQQEKMLIINEGSYSSLKIIPKAYKQYWKYYLNEDLDTFHESVGPASPCVYSIDDSLNVNMCLISVLHGMTNAVKYFWGKMSDKEREKNKTGFTVFAMVEHGGFIDRYEKSNNFVQCACDLNMADQFLNICMFMLNHMRSFELRCFYSMKNSLLSLLAFKVLKAALLRFWPLQEHFMLMLDIMQIFSNEGETCLSLLKLIATKKNEDFIVFPAENNIYSNFLYRTWCVIPTEAKKLIANLPQYQQFIYDLLHDGDISTIKLIFNDPEMAETRYKILESGFDVYWNMLKEGRHELLNAFIDKILITEEDKLTFFSVF